MITIIFRIIIKKGTEEEFKNVIKDLTISAYTEPERCIQYAFHQNVHNPREFILYEQWDDQKTLNAHLRRLEVLFGPKAKNSSLPTKLNDYFESTEDLLYKESNN